LFLFYFDVNCEVENLVIIHGRICACAIHEINSCVKKDSHQNNSHKFTSETIDEQLLIVTVIINVTLQFLNLEECRVTRLLHHSQISGDPSYTVNY
jgi:hypothetical protein